jgi:transposase InsO family protein
MHAVALEALLCSLPVRHISTRDANALRSRLESAALMPGVSPSTRSVGDFFDDAMCESFNATLECETTRQHRFKTQRKGSLAVLDFIDGYYHPYRSYCRPTSRGEELRSLISSLQLSAESS